MGLCLSKLYLFFSNFDLSLPINFESFNFHKFIFSSSAKSSFISFYFPSISFSVHFPSEYGPFEWPFSVQECVHLDGHSSRLTSYCVLYRIIVHSVHLLSDCSPFRWPFSFERFAL